MIDSRMRCVLISDFNIANLAGYLGNSRELPHLSVTTAPFGQVMETLLADNAHALINRCEAAVIWTRPQGIVPSFNEPLNGRHTTLANILDEVDRFTDVLCRVAERATWVLVPSWVIPTFHRGLGIGDLRDGGTHYALWQMNTRLLTNLQGTSNAYVLNTQRWIEAVGTASFDPRYWYAAKIPFANAVFKLAASDIQAGLRALIGQARKLIILDLDNTLWGGIVGEVGWENLRLGGHDPVGEAYLDFQSALKTLRARGILLAIVSKNEQPLALQAIDENPEMLLRTSDFVGWRINWKDKAANIVELMAELNLGMQSALFIDDQPAERARIRDALPEVLVPEWPVDPMLYKQSLLSLTCFDTVVMSDEDLSRTDMYQAEGERKASRISVQSIDDWLRCIDLEVTIEDLCDQNLQRTVQLLNKTNQMNLSTRRMTEDELVEWRDSGNRRVWCFRVRDKFGDSGLTGIMSLEWEDRSAQIVDFVLSCRVFGRRIEHLMAHIAIDFAAAQGVANVEAVYAPTAKNKPCLEFWMDSGFRYEQNAHRFRWSTRQPYPAPDMIHVDDRRGSSVPA